MGTAVNPYVAGPPVGDSVAFFGRTAEVEELTTVLDGPDASVVLIAGAPATGRSSLLTELSQGLDRRGGLHTVRMDLQAHAWDPLDDVIVRLADAVGRSLRLTEPGVGDWTDHRFAERWLARALERIPEDDRLVMIFDEFPVVHDPRSRQAAGALLPWLAELFERFPTRLRAIFTSDLRIPDQESVIQRNFPALHRVELGMLDRQAATDLVRMSLLDRSLRWGEEAVDRVLALTSGHPFLTQHLCASVWERAHGPDGDAAAAATADDIDNAVMDTIDGASQVFETLWAGLPPGCRVVAGVVAWHDDWSPTAHSLPELLVDAGVHQVSSVLEDDAPRELRRQGMLTDDPDTCSFAVPLMRLWIQAHLPLTEALQDLDQIDPMAEQLFQEAERIWQTATHDDARREAIARLVEALDLNPNHSSATELLAAVHQRRGDLDSALEFLERLYEAQPERARPRLVRLMLQRADEAVEEHHRLEWIDRALRLAPDHTEALRKRDGILERSVPPVTGEHLDLHEPTTPNIDHLQHTPSVARALSPSDPPTPVVPVWNPPEILGVDETEIERLYQGGVAALERGDREAAITHLGRIAALRPLHRETIRHLYRAVHGQDPALPRTVGVPRSWFAIASGVAIFMSLMLVVSVSGGPSAPDTTPIIEPVEVSTDAPVTAEPAPEPVAPPPPEPEPEPEPEYGATPKLHPDQAAPALVSQGWEARQAGELKTAETYFDAAVTRDPRSADAHYGLAVVADALGQSTDAHVHYCAALHHAGDDPRASQDSEERVRKLGRKCE